MSIAADRIIAVRTGKTVYKDGDSVIKVFSKPYTKAEVMLEAFNQAQFEAAGMAVPTVQEIFPAEGGWAIRYEYAHGKTMAALIAAQPESADELFALLIKIQRRIFACHTPLLEPLSNKLARSIKAGLGDNAAAAELCARLAAVPNGEYACHGALVPRDIIIAESGAYCVLNWADAARGNYLFDIADTYLQLLLEDHAAADDLPTRYISAFGADGAEIKSQITELLPICAAARMAKANERERAALCELVPK